MKIQNKQDPFYLFLILWIGSLINTIGSGLTTFVLTVSIYQEIQSTFLMSLVAIIGLLPRIICSPLAGALVDQYDRRLLLILGDGFSGLGVILIYFQLTNHSPVSQHLFLVLLGLTISAIFSSITTPALKASISDILTQDQYAQAASMLQINDSATYLISPILASFLLNYMPLSQILLIDCLTIIVTLICTYLVKRSIRNHHRIEIPSYNTWFYLKEGNQYLKAHSNVLLLIIYLSLITFFIGFIQVLITPVLIDMAGPQVYGTVLTIAASGMLIFGIYISIHPIQKHYLKIVFNSLIFAGSMIMLIGMINHIIIITCFAFLLFGSLVFTNVSLDYLIRVNVSNDYLGRVLGWAANISQFAYLLSYLFAGLLADHCFNPLLVEDGLLSSSLGRLFGTGPSRGTALLISLAGAS